MGIRITGDCDGCHRFSVLHEGEPLESDEELYKVRLCAKCKSVAINAPLAWMKPAVQKAAIAMGRSFMCSECGDAGHFGFLDPEGWLAGEIGDCWPFCLMIKRTCPKCDGDPQSQLPPRPNPPGNYFDHGIRGTREHRRPELAAAISELQSLGATLKDAAWEMAPNRDFLLLQLRAHAMQLDAMGREFPVPHTP